MYAYTAMALAICFSFVVIIPMLGARFVKRTSVAALTLNSWLAIGLPLILIPIVFKWMCFKAGIYDSESDDGISRTTVHNALTTTLIQVVIACVVTTVLLILFRLIQQKRIESITKLQ